MTEVIASGIIDADPETVWAGLRDFSGPARWVRNIATSEIEGNQAGDQVSAIRRLVFDNGNELRERLIALSDHDRYFRYAVLPTEKLPISDYNGKVQVIPVVEGNRSLVHWCGNFSVSEAEQDEVCAWVRGIYQRDIEDMQAYFARS
ncbi:hypothetical protein AUP42_13310 [Thalassospira lucentensis]|uniref:SRPBCC family protein n=1 Tax=Thalassospira lucentensis TaxID=168935 RepID=A0A154L9B7_9PROT|nr:MULTISPECIES: SRPBCC family protein [Thalassospira]KZB67317.1 hypothetical protein AUP42_13310 [Thalassospira lucentensis]MCH2275368.1 SRPBCC family protein [Thalassospira sp.]